MRRDGLRRVNEKLVYMCIDFGDVVVVADVVLNVVNCVLNL